MLTPTEDPSRGPGKIHVCYSHIVLGVGPSQLSEGSRDVRASATPRGGGIKLGRLLRPPVPQVPHKGLVRDWSQPALSFLSLFLFLPSIRLSCGQTEILCERVLWPWLREGSLPRLMSVNVTGMKLGMREVSSTMATLVDPSVLPP